MKKCEAFTLIETLIYSALVAFFIGAAIVFVSSIVGSTDDLLERNEVVANQEFVERKLYWVFSRATSVSIPAVNNSSTQLKVNGSSTGVYPALFSLSNNRITLSLASGTPQPITNNRVKAESFLVEHFSNIQSSSTIKIFLSLSSDVFSHIKSSTTLYHVFHE